MPPTAAAPCRKPRRVTRPKVRRRNTPSVLFIGCLLACRVDPTCKLYILYSASSRTMPRASPGREQTVDPFELRPLGGTSVKVTRFGFGGAPMGERFVPVDNAT